MSCESKGTAGKSRGIKPLVLWPGTWTAEIGRTALVSADGYPRVFSYDSISEDREKSGLGSTNAGSSWNSARVGPTPGNTSGAGCGRLKAASVPTGLIASGAGEPDYGRESS